MEKKQSSIEWLGLELNIIFHDLTPELWEQVEVKFQQAKAMHKEEIIDSYIEGHSIYGENTNAEHYYNETFGGNGENSIEEKLYTKDEVLDLLVNMNSWPTTFEGREDITE
jgi:hypothetical protein